MSDEAGIYTTEHTVMDKDLEIRELKHQLEVKNDKIKKLEEEVVQLIITYKVTDYPKDDVDYAVADELEDDGQSYDNRVKMSGDNPTGELDESEDNFTEQLSFSFKQE